MEKTAMTRYSDVFNTLKDHDNEISSRRWFYRWPHAQQRHLLPMRLNRRTLLVWQIRRQCTVWKRGEQIPVQSPQGVRTECKLPCGEVIDEWDLYRRDHPQPTR